MASFTEDLLADRQRLSRALAGLVEEQREVLARLQADRESVAHRLDRSVVKLLVMVEQFGRSSSEVALCQREAEDVQTLANEQGRKIHQNEALLSRYRARLAAAEAGDLESAARSDSQPGPQVEAESQGDALNVQ